jgi:hypothetical protein
MRLFARVAVYALLTTPLAFALAAGCGSNGQSSGSASGTNSTGSSAGGSGSGTASTGSNTSGSTSTSTSTGSSTSSGIPVPTEIATCQGKVYFCGDLLDNDGDGLIDSQDPDCLGPCDNTEDSYFGGIPGQNNAPCKMDCYFDQDTGTGNDSCYWDHHCDPHEIAPNYYPESNLGNQCAYDPTSKVGGSGETCDQLNAAQSNTCHDYCGPLTPNGCDCFGCCELPAGGGNFVWLGSVDSSKIGTCDIAHVADPTKCQPCKPVDSCFNGCGKCEICIGKPTVPPECFPPDGGTPTGAGGSTSTSTSGAGGSGGGDAQCASGVQPCGLPGQALCPFNYTCITGCCQKVPQ